MKRMATGLLTLLLIIGVTSCSPKNSALDDLESALNEIGWPINGAMVSTNRSGFANYLYVDLTIDDDRLGAKRLKEVLQRIGDSKFKKYALLSVSVWDSEENILKFSIEDVLAVGLRENNFEKSTGLIKIRKNLLDELLQNLQD